MKNKTDALAQPVKPQFPAVDPVSGNSENRVDRDFDADAVMADPDLERPFAKKSVLRGHAEVKQSAGSRSYQGKDMKGKGKRCADGGSGNPNLVPLGDSGGGMGKDARNILNSARGLPGGFRKGAANPYFHERVDKKDTDGSRGKS